MSVTVEIDGRSYTDIERAIQNMMGRLERGIAESGAKVSAELRNSLHGVAAEMAQRHSRRWNGRLINDSENLQRRSGEGLRSLLRSVRSEPVRHLEDVEASISGAGLSFHENDNVTVARRSRYLTIPLPAALDSRGVEIKRSAREWTNTFVRRSRRGNLLIFARTSRGPVPLYLLKQRTVSPARLRLGMVIDRSLPWWEQRLADRIAESIEEKMS